MQCDYCESCCKNISNYTLHHSDSQGMFGFQGNELADCDRLTAVILHSGPGVYRQPPS